MQATGGAALSGARPDPPPDPPADPPATTPPGRVRPRVALLLAVAAAAYALDQGSKLLAVAELSGRAPIDLFGGVLTLRLTRNPGAAFSLAEGYTIVLTVIASVVVVAILRVARRLGSWRWALALGLLLGGALGNLTDRIFRAPAPLRGHVVDFLELPNWPVFNLADSAIVGAGLLIALLALRNVPLEGRAAPAP